MYSIDRTLMTGRLVALSQWGLSLNLVCFCCFSLFLVGCVAAPGSMASEPCALPNADEDWAVSAPGAAGFDAAALCTVLQETANSKANVHGFLVERHGRLVAELYRNGPDSPINIRYGIGNPFSSDVSFDAQTLHDTRSISKSIVGLIYGIELEKGKVNGLDTPVLGAYADQADLHAVQLDSVTLKHLLSMSSGLQWEEWGRGAFSSDETRLYWKNDQVRFVLERPVTATPGSRFNYNSGGTAVLADILVRSTGKSLTELAREEIFEPLHISRSEWAVDMRGRPTAFAGLRLRPRDMLKIGRLVNTRGRWGDRQIVPEHWITESTRQQVPTDINVIAIGGGTVGYGYQWWTGNVDLKGRQLAWVSALGNGGQRIFVVPDMDMTIVITAGDYGSAEILRVENRIILEVLSAITDGLVAN